MKVGDRIRYIGHTAKCMSCVQAEPKPQPVTVVVAGALDDRDEFGVIDIVWDRRIGRSGELKGFPSWDLDTVSIHLDGEDSGCKAYIEHVEVIS